MDSPTRIVNPADVLVIDDEITFDLVADWPEAAGYGVRTAVDCCADLGEVELAAPVLVVTEQCLPGTGVGEIISDLTQDHPVTPIIAISGNLRLRVECADDAPTLGAARTLAKS